MGDKKDCDCIEEVESNGIFPDPLDWLDALQKLLGIIEEYEPGSSKKADPECDMHESSGVPFNVFSDGVYKRFCEAVDKDKKTELAQIVGPDGFEIPPKAKRNAAVQKRTPPPDPDAYVGYSFELSLSGGDESCSIGGHTAGYQNRMALQTKLDTSCGIYSYKITRPPSADKPEPPEVPETPQPGPLVCKEYLQEYDKCFNDIHEKLVESCIDAMRAQFPGDGNRVTSSMANITQVLRKGRKGVTYMMNIGWIPGCTDYESQVADNPQGKSGDNPDQSISSSQILRGTYKNCLGNHGIGGYQDYGCVRYGFYPTNINGVFASPPHPEKYWEANMNLCG
ncbi:MAG: hypothetical protein Q9217_001925 [Psora testacea]